MDFSFLKRQMRTDLIRRRSAIEPDYALSSAQSLLSFIRRMEIPAGSTVSAYWPMKSEIDVRPVMHFLHEAGMTVCLPVVTEKGEAMLFRRWAPEETLVVGMYGVEQPGENCEAVVPDVLLLPLVAFDRNGGRLGYGGGFYDRTLVRLRREGLHRIGGVAFAMQEVEKVPQEETDETLDFIVTEKEFIEVG